MVIRKLSQLFVFLCIVGLTFVAGYSTYPLLHADRDPATESAESAASQDDDMGVYWQAWGILERDFYGKKPDATHRIYGAIRGMVEAYNDPYTYFVEPQPRELERDELRGKFGGIGANIELTPEGYVLRPMPGQAAAQAGILSGDLLLLVDGHEITTSMSLDDVVTLVRGPIGVETALVIRRQEPENGAGVELTVHIERVEIQTPSIEWRLIEEAVQPGNIGYIHHALFTERSATEMRAALAELTAQGADRFILDLRGNPGGLVSAAVEIADMWLDSGPILVEQRADGTESITEAQSGVLVEAAPLVVIVDGGSASASEILAGALQDHKRALLVGEKTFGKGSVQLIHELPDQSSLHVTNAQWLTPNRHQITDNGLVPDIPVEPGSDALPSAIVAVQKAAVAKASPASAEE
jgi:carboxyl-terminal processing protease